MAPTQEYERKVREAKAADLEKMLAQNAHGSPNWECVADEIRIRSLTKQSWYKKPIGLIGIGIVIAVFSAAAVYIIRNHLGIPL